MHDTFKLGADSFVYWGAGRLKADLGLIACKVKEDLLIVLGGRPGTVGMPGVL